MSKIVIDAGEEYARAQDREKSTVRMLSFRLSGENYCADVKCVKEVIRISRITNVPNTPEFIAGVINLRGEIISLVDIRPFLGLTAQEVAGEPTVLVMDMKGETMGVLVDRIRETVRIDEESIQPTLSTIKGRLAAYTKGQATLGDDIFAILDLERILGCEEMEKLKGGEL